MSAAAPIDVGRWITSWQLWLILFPFNVLSLTSHLLDDMTLPTAVLTALVGALVGGVVMALASVTVFPRRRQQSPTITQALLLWFFVGVATYLGAEAVSRGLFGTADSPAHVLRDVSRYSLALLLRTVLVVVGASALVNTRAELSETQLALAAQQDELGQAEAYLTELRRRYTDFVKQSIEPRLRGLMSEVELLKVTSTSGSTTAGIADELEDFGSHQVRALSHQIVDLVEVPFTQPLQEPTPGQGVPSGLALLGGWIRELPPVLPWLIFFTVTRFGYGTYEPITAWGALGYAALFALGWSILTLARLVGGRKTGRENNAPTWIGVLVLLAVGFATWYVGLGFGSLGDSLHAAQLTLIAQSVATLLGVWFVNYILIQRDRSHHTLLDATAALESFVLKRDLAAEQIRYRLAGILHGPVQGRLALASMTTRQFFDGQNDDPQARMKALTTVGHILTSIDDELVQLASGVPDTTSFQEFMAELEDAWAGVLEIETRIGTSAAMTLAHVPDVQESVNLVVKEAIMNARRHGRARVVFVSLEMYDRTKLQVSVLDDGIGASGQRGTGLGTRLYDRATSSWSLADVGFGGSLFSALIDVPAHSGTPETSPAFAKVG